jgi:pyrroline-5-carboxylate reductase
MNRFRGASNASGTDEAQLRIGLNSTRHGRDEMTLGFIGTGTMTAAIVTGLNTAGAGSRAIVLSPRNPEVAAELASRYPRVTIAASNQEVLDNCDTIVLAVRPQIAESVLSSLRFRADHHMISIIATFSLRRLHELTSPATRVARAVPLLSAAKRESPTAIYPRDPEALEFFSLIGAPFAVDTEQEFDARCAATAAVASYFVFADVIATWLTERGITPAIARDYMAQVLPRLGECAAKAPTSSFRAMAADHATAGGLNEQLLRHLEERNIFVALTEALDQVMLRVTTANH